MRVLLTNTFKRTVKKLHRNQIMIVEEAIEHLQKNPTTGDLKIGDLAKIRVYKFHIHHQLMLLAYIYEEDENILTLVSCGQHENFNDKLKQ